MATAMALDFLSGLSFLDHQECANCHQRLEHFLFFDSPIHFLAVNSDVFRGFDTDANLTALDLYNGNFDIVVDADGFTCFPGKYQHTDLSYHLP